MCKIDGSMDKHLYIEILEDHLQKSVEFYGKDLDDMVFQRDNDPKHKAKTVQAWLREQNIEVLDWPAQSPDLNPIEHPWVELKRRVSDYDEMPKFMAQLWERVQTCPCRKHTR